MTAENLNIFEQYQHLTRQLDVIPVETLDTEIHIIGVGAIGSLVSLNLAKMGFMRQVVFDPDTVTLENLSCQFYRRHDVDKFKVDALNDLIEDFTGESLWSCYNSLWDDPTLSKDARIVIVAVDDMAARAHIFKALQNNINVRYVIDARMSLEDGMLYVMNPHDGNDVNSYMKTLYSNEDAVQERCTAKSTIYTASMIAGLVAKAVKNIVTQQEYPRTTLWSIGENSMLSYKGGTKPSPPKLQGVRNEVTD